MTFRTPPGCSEFHHSQYSRRSFLQIGSLGLAGLGLPQLLRAESESPKRATARSVILLFQFGGPPQHDTFDPKPNAPAEIRGEFGSVTTSVPGVRVCDRLPKLSKLFDQYSLIRSVNHNKAAHNSGAYFSLSGREPLRDIVTSNASATDFPHPGSIVSHLAPGPRDVPTFVSLPTMIADGPFRTPGEFAGFLGRAHDPLWVLTDPNSPSFNVAELSLPKTVNPERLEDRRQIFAELDARSELTERLNISGAMRDHQMRALGLLTAPRTKKAFAIEEEPKAVRDRYGRTTYGQSTLLARRLVEAGVRFVTVYYSAGIGGWDTHKDNFNTLRNSRLPQTDETLSALLEDLKTRGMLGETLVYWTGDFGRTPKVNKDAGRDHWPQCQTVLMAGGGIQGGRVIGASDPMGAFPVDKPCKPGDITATVFHALGLDPETHIQDQLKRPLPISDGKPIRELF